MIEHAPGYGPAEHETLVHRPGQGNDGWHAPLGPARNSDDAGADYALNYSGNPVRYFDGTVKFSSTDLESHGFGKKWGHTRNWTNHNGYAASSAWNSAGIGVMVSQMPYLLQPSADDIAAVFSGTSALKMKKLGGLYQIDPKFWGKEKFSAVGGQFHLADTRGNILKFYNFTDDPPKAGKFAGHVDAYGTHVTATYDAFHRLEEVVRNSPGGQSESYLYAYFSGGPGAGQLRSVTLQRRQVSTDPWTILRKVEYSYYADGSPHGIAKNLRTATIKDGANPGNILATKYYRYYSPQSPDAANGYYGGLKYVFEPDSYARLVAAKGTDLDNLSNDDVNDFADYHFQYDVDHRVKTEIVRASGSSTSSEPSGLPAGLGKYTFTYESNPNYIPSDPADHNAWLVKTTETLPDHTGNQSAGDYVSQNIVYTNAYGEVMLKVYENGFFGNTKKWLDFYRRDSQGRVILRAYPSAITGYNEEKSDLLDLVNSNYVYLHDSAGLTVKNTFYEGHLSNVQIAKGELGTEVAQYDVGYLSHSYNMPNSISMTIYVIGATSNYLDPNTVRTTTYDYTWFGDSQQVQTNRLESVKVTSPEVSADKHGPGVPDERTIVYNVFRQPVWFLDGKTDDPERVISYFQRDIATGAVTKRITDVKTSESGEFTNLPTNWSTANGKGLHLRDEIEVDDFGRTKRRTKTSLDDPNGTVTYFVYNDPLHEIRVYPGWTGSTTTGPTRVYRQDRTHSPSYLEALTMSATPNVAGGRPDGTEGIGNVQTLSRTYVSPGGQVTRSDDYFNLAGVTYSSALYIGTAGTVNSDGTVSGNYWSTLYGYDVHGRPNSTQSPAGTLYLTSYDGLDRPVSESVGTSTANAVIVNQFEYDRGQVGDSNLTTLTEKPNALVSSLDRVSKFYYDWRNRMVTSKTGVQTGELDDVQRPLYYYDYDNLNEVTAVEYYDGDTLTDTQLAQDLDANGVPDRPAEVRRRARSETEYDQQGRPFKVHTYTVNQSDGAIPLTNNRLTVGYWYDHRGNLIKTSEPSGLVYKTQYDGIDRPKIGYITDEIATPTWADAGIVTNNLVLEQTEYLYDNNSNTKLITHRDRFHDATQAGALQSPSIDPKARVSYVANYYDLADRLTHLVDVGTNGGTGYTRPATPPLPSDRSDTLLLTEYAYNPAGWVSDAWDPRNLQNKTSYDALGQITETTEHYMAPGTPTHTRNRKTQYSYDGNSNVTLMTAVLPAGAFQKTQYLYGVMSGANDFYSNDVLSSIRYPDKTTGEPNATAAYRETFRYNALAEVKSQTDRNQNVHTYTFDVVGRHLADAITQLGANVDGTVRRLETAFDTAGRPFKYTSWSADSGGSVVNQVERTFNGLNQLTAEYQGTRKRR